MKFRRLYEEEISPKKIRKDLWDKFKKLSEEEIISLACGEINEIKPFTPMLISKGGKLLSVADSNIPTDVMLNGDRRKAVHADYTNATVYSLLKRDYPELKWDDVFSHLLAEDYGLLGQEHLSDNLGFVRLNTGTTAVEKRFYMVLPVGRPSAGQWDWIEKYLEDGASHNAGEVLVYGNGGDDFHFYSFIEYTPEEILGKLKRYYASGKFYESFDFIPHLYSENDENEKKIKDVVNKFRSMSEDDLIRQYGGVTSTIGGGSSGSNVLIVTPKGKIIDVDSVVGTHDTMHIDYIVHILYYILQDMYGDNQDLGLLFDTEDGIDEMASAELEHLRSNGWITINTGEGVNEDRFYGVFPSREEPRPTSSQWDSIEKILEYGYDSGKEEFMAYFDRGHKFHSYDLKSDFPEDIIKKMKRYYASGNLYEEYELNEVYPNKGESKEDFISRFMRATVKEYPDREQRFAVALSTFDRHKNKS